MRGMGRVNDRGPIHQRLHLVDAWLGPLSPTSTHQLADEGTFFYKPTYSRGCRYRSAGDGKENCKFRPVDFAR